VLQTILSGKDLGILVLLINAVGMVAIDIVSRHAFVNDALALDARNVRNTAEGRAVFSDWFRESGVRAASTALKISLCVDAFPGSATSSGNPARSPSCVALVGVSDVASGENCTGASLEDATFAVAFGVRIRAHALCGIRASWIGTVTILAREEAGASALAGRNRIQRVVALGTRGALVDHVGYFSDDGVFAGQNDRAQKQYIGRNVQRNRGDKQTCLDDSDSFQLAGEQQ